MLPQSWAWCILLFFHVFNLKLPPNDGKFERRNLSPDSGIVNLMNACLSQYFCLSWEGGRQILTETECSDIIMKMAETG